MTQNRVVVLATGNANKLREIRDIMNLQTWELRGIKEIEDFQLPEEVGKTYEENALIKARSCVERLGLPSLADDSGLEIDALGGAPGVISSRYGGVEGDAERNIGRVLKEMEDIPWHYRTARFICCAVLVLPSGDVHTEWGIVRGHITLEKFGSNGFGYDPIFVPEGYENTFAEMSNDQKNKISHRGIAFRKMAEYLEGLNL